MAFTRCRYVLNGSGVLMGCLEASVHKKRDDGVYFHSIVPVGSK